MRKKQSLEVVMHGMAHQDAALEYSSNVPLNSGELPSYTLHQHLTTWTADSMTHRRSIL